MSSRGYANTVEKSDASLLKPGTSLVAESFNSFGVVVNKNQRIKALPSDSTVSYGEAIPDAFGASAFGVPEVATILTLALVDAGAYDYLRTHKTVYLEAVAKVSQLLSADNMICLNCGTSFRKVRVKHVYCTSRCRQEAWWKRHSI